MIINIKDKKAHKLSKTKKNNLKNKIKTDNIKIKSQNFKKLEH